jgi:hypothetical protein
MAPISRPNPPDPPDPPDDVSPGWEGDTIPTPSIRDDCRPIIPPKRFGYAFDLVESPPSADDSPNPTKTGPQTFFPVLPTPPEVGPIRFPELPPVETEAAELVVVFEAGLVVVFEAGLVVVGSVVAGVELV